MLRPERMSKVSIAGAKSVMPTVIETVHELNLVHLSDYDGSWEGFDNGNPIEGAEDASEKLVVVRALESTLDLSADDGAPGTIDDEWEHRLEEIRTRINALDDERSDVREQLRQVEDRLDRVGPFAELGIDLDLLTGYDSVDVVVGEGSENAVDSALEAADEIQAFETFTGGDVLAIVAAPADGESTDGLIDDALVGVELSRHPIPDTDADPDTYVGELEAERDELEADLERIDDELAEIKVNEGGFLLRVEEELSIEVQRAEAPLQFATTQRAFIAEGWLPVSDYDRLVAALEERVGDRVEIEELVRADYDDAHGAAAHGDHDADDSAAADEEEPAESDREAPKAATDGGRSAAVTMDDEPPVVLNNLTPAKPFELMVKMVSQPKYSELDPTFFIFLTYPFAFGFMIGDIGYGLLYMLMGWGAWKVFDSDAGKALGTIGIWAGVFTVLFGYLYDDIFGVHMADIGIHLPLAGTLTKGLQTGEWALLWILLSLVFGIVHLNLGLVAGFVNELSHGLKAAVYERFSWILAMNGLFIWLFTHNDAGSADLGFDTTASATKPEFLTGAGEEAILYEFFGFAGFPEFAGIVALVALFVGLGMIGAAEGIAGLLESPAWAFGHALSYLRMVAVLLAKGGMAFVVNLLVFGAWETGDGYMHFSFFESPSAVEGAADVTFEGLVWIGLEGGAILTVLGLLAAVLVFVLGHIVVLLLGITAAGIQMLRLEYVEFFQKFYEGGGEEYEPFGEHAQSAD